MEANKIRLLEFLGSSKRTFNIPVYQRNYDWQEEQCRRLFRDIERIAKNNFQIDHFLGTVVYVVSHTQPNFNEYIVIDGQQRITSITLLLYALYEHIEDTQTKLDIYESYIINRNAPEQLRIKLKPIESDMHTYERILNDDTPDPHSNIYKNYLLFKNLIVNSPIQPDKLYEAMDHLELVYIQLEQNKPSENPQMIFESLNSTGLSLTQADLIRNFLLMNHSYQDQTNLYKIYWLKIENLLGNTKISEFVRDYLTMKTARISKSDKVYESFKEFANNPDNNFDEEGLLEDLLIFARYYACFLYLNSANESINYCLNQFQQLKSTTVYPALLYLFDECYSYKNLSETELVEVMNVLISYIFRRLICGYPTNALNKIFASLSKEIDVSIQTTYSDKILSILTAQTSSGTFPTDKEFETNFISKDLYKSKIDKYTLYMLENHLKREKILISRDITIEHIMPQKLTPEWKIDLGRKYEDIHTQYLHTIGNLTISGHNSELSNNSFASKKNIYQNSNISLCRSICDYDVWNDETIKNRAMSLFKTALKIWSLPPEYNSRNANKQAISYNTLYNIQTEINITGEKPRQLIIMDTEYSVSSWKDMLKTLCAVFFELDSTILYNLAHHNDSNSKSIAILNNTSDGMNSPHQIAPGLFIETNRSALDILNYSKLICDFYESSDEVYFMLKSK